MVSFEHVCRLGKPWGLGCQEVKVGGLLMFLMLLQLSYLTLNTFCQSLRDGIPWSQLLLEAHWRRRWRGWRNRWTECPTATGWGFVDIIIHALSWVSSHHLPQGSSYHQNSVKHWSDINEYINAGKTEEFWTWSITRSNYDSFASIKSSSMEKLHRDSSMQNRTMSWTPKSKRTFPGFQWFFTRPQTVDALCVMIFKWWSCWNCILDRLQHWKKYKIWGLFWWYSSLCWIEKSW
jgi:hypothetical protein